MKVPPPAVSVSNFYLELNMIKKQVAHELIYQLAGHTFVSFKSINQPHSWQPWLLDIQKFQMNGSASHVQQVQLVLNALSFLWMCRENMCGW